MNAENSFHSVELFLKILDDFKTVTNCFDFYPEELIGYELFTDVGLQTEVQELLFCVELAFILVVNFFVLFFLLVWILFFLLIVSVFEEKSCIFYCQILTLIDLNMWVPFSDGFLFLFLDLIQLSVIDPFLLEFL